MRSGIYTITNTTNGKMYVGYTVNLVSRKSYHLGKLAANIHKNIHLQRAYNKDGKDAFLFEVLEYWPEELLCTMEHYWANMLQVHNDKYGYNIRPTHPHGEPRHSAETRRKIGERGKGRVLTEQQKQDRRSYRHTPEARERITKALKERNPEVYKKIGEKTKQRLKQNREAGKVLNEEERKQRRRDAYKKWYYKQKDKI